MARLHATTVTGGVLIVLALGSASAVRAQLGIGTWVKQAGGPAGGDLTMTVEPCCNGGVRLVYRLVGQSDVLMTIDSPMDGSDVPVMAGGKPTGETMGIKRLDDQHTFTVLKMNGQAFGTAKSTLSADGKTLTVEDEFTTPAGGQTVGKQTETWLRK